MVRFRRTWEAPNIEASHAVLHIAKATGKLAACCDDVGHGREAKWLTWIADVCISAEGLASILGFSGEDVTREIDRRVAEKNA